MKIRSLIIDDDPIIRETLRDMLEMHIPEVDLLGIAISGMEGIEKIALHDPDLVFLDVQLRDMTGFEMLSRLKRITFQTIFITSYSHYAIRAIRFNALDYLLKPIDTKELKAAVRRYRSLSDPHNNSARIELALKNMETEDPEEQTLVISEQKGELKVMLKDIVRIEGERNYSYFHFTNRNKKLVSKNMAEYEELLAEKGFFRCHKSHLINHVHIRELSGDSSVTMTDGIRIPIARRRLANFRKWHFTPPNQQ
jgi:two-component system LytT family response regulator